MFTKQSLIEKIEETEFQAASVFDVMPQTKIKKRAFTI